MKAYFASDMHLGAAYISDKRAHEKRVVKWLEQIAPTADRLYLLGDVIDYWFEYRDVVPRGFTRFFGALASLVDGGVDVTWLKGNHDIWTFGYLEQELGVKVVDEELVAEIDNHRFYLAHGDGEGSYGRKYKMMRALFRSRAAQRAFASIHPRLTVPLGRHCSSDSRVKGSGPACNALFLPDDSSLMKFARRYNSTTPEKVDYFIFGHEHQLVDCPLDMAHPDGSRLIILDDWLTRPGYAVWDGEDVEIKLFHMD